MTFNSDVSFPLKFMYKPVHLLAIKAALRDWARQ
jgi:hypothetical protein